MAPPIAAQRIDDGNAIARRYGHAAANEWRRLLAHFDLGDGFALIVLIVPDRDGAAICRGELEKQLVTQKKHLTGFMPVVPADLSQIATSLPDQATGSDIGAVWIEAVVARSARDFPEWEQAWRRTLEGLNQQRNPLRQSFHCPIVITAAPWLVPLFRDVAPDLWSIRSQVVRIEPEHDLRRERTAEARDTAAGRDRPDPIDSPDPELAQREAGRLLGAPDRVRDRALLLARAARGFHGQNRLPEAEAALRESSDLIAGLGDPVGHGNVMHELGRAILDQGRAAEAEATFRRALALAEEGGATAAESGITMDNLGRTILDQGRSAEAEATFRRALALKEEGDATATSRGITTDSLGRAIRDQGRAAEAEETFRRALALKEEGDAPADLVNTIWQDLAAATKAST